MNFSRLRYFTFLLILSLFTQLAFGQNQFTTYPNDPLNLKEITLDNGMTVFLVENHDKPEIVGSIVVNVGSKNDPADNTGMAHYLEHMLFKGTKTLGTIDYEKEKVHLDKINHLYDQLGQTTDEAKRTMINQQINDESRLAAKYALPNEFDRIIAEMGGTRLNAFTSTDMTVYLNKFPPNQIEKWLDVYTHRFKDPVFRLFQTELETVYEEKNRGMNEPMNYLFEKFIAKSFDGHPYGDQTTIGKTEHLKNPSLSTMYAYFHKFYVPNNMALVLVGDFDSEAILPLIKEKLNQLPFQELDKNDDFKISPISGKMETTIKSSPIKIAFYGYRIDGLKAQDRPKLDLMAGLLSNESETGLMDELYTSKQVMATELFPLSFNDHGVLAILNVPKLIGQSFEKAEALLLGQLDSLKSGKFDDTVLKAVKAGLIKQKKLDLETNEKIAFELYNLFVSDKNWTETVNYVEALEALTKADIIAYANSVFGDDFVVVYSKMGSTKMETLKKPNYEPIVIRNTENQNIID